MIGFPTTPQGHLAQNPQMLQFMFPALPMRMCPPPPSSVPGYRMFPTGVPVGLPDHTAMQMTIPEQVVSPSPSPVVFFPPQFNAHPLQFTNMHQMAMPKVNNKPPSPSPSVEEQQINKRSPPGFDNSKASNSATPSRKPTAQHEANTSRRRNSKRKLKKQVQKDVPEGEYRPSYRSKQDMIDKVFSALSVKYTALGLLENKGLRGDDTIRVHVKNFKALTRIEEALIAVESHPKVQVSRVSLPFSFRNEFQKKGFLVYLKLEDVTMVPHAQSVFRKFDEFKKCGVMRETGQYVESLPLIEAKKPVDPVEEKSSNMTDYGSSTESSSSEQADSDSD